MRLPVSSRACFSHLDDFYCVGKSDSHLLQKFFAHRRPDSRLKGRQPTKFHLTALQLGGRQAVAGAYAKSKMCGALTARPWPQPNISPPFPALRTRSGFSLALHSFLHTCFQSAKSSVDATCRLNIPLALFGRDSFHLLDWQEANS